MTNKEEKEQKVENGGSTNSMNLALIGGVVGAGIGLLSSPGTSSKMIKSLGESEVMRIAGKELKRSAQEIITEQALNGIRQSASGYMSKYEGRLLAPTKKNDKQESSSTNEEEQSSQYEEIKEDNKNLNDRLDKIESMLSQLVESKK